MLEQDAIFFEFLNETIKMALHRTDDGRFVHREETSLSVTYLDLAIM